jgi:ascorbate-specific PTS system EIIC-type component UlaA
LILSFSFLILFTSKRKLLSKNQNVKKEGRGYYNMNWIKTAVLMGAVTLVLLVTGVRKLDREEEGKRRSGSKNNEPPAA